MARRAALAALLVVALVRCGGGGGHELVVGAVEDAAKYGDATAEMERAREGGMRAIVLSAVWHRGEREPTDLDALRRAVDAADSAHIRPIVAVYSFSRDTPLADEEQADFAAFAAAIPRALPAVRDVIVGNEPNLNLFWMPQFDSTGADAAALAYERLLARTYDALKAVDDDVNVIGGGLAARGGDNPDARRQTHSPTAFLLDVGNALRASGRDRPIMDMLSLHPYGETARVPPTIAHPRTTTIGIADYRKLVALLGRAFAGTAQPGRDLPIAYGEYGVETTIPQDKASLYTGREPALTVDELTQGRFYVDAIRAAACQPTVRMLFLFHVEDERELTGLQSGPRYADGSPKTSFDAVRAAAEHPDCRR